LARHIRQNPPSKQEKKKDPKSQVIVVNDRFSIRRFAGDDIEKARYYPEDKHWLLEFESNVMHYDVAVEVKG